MAGTGGLPVSSAGWIIFSDPFLNHRRCKFVRCSLHRSRCLVIDCSPVCWVNRDQRGLARIVVVSPGTVTGANEAPLYRRWVTLWPESFVRSFSERWSSWKRNRVGQTHRASESSRRTGNRSRSLERASRALSSPPATINRILIHYRMFNHSTYAKCIRLSVREQPGEHPSTGI